MGMFDTIYWKRTNKGDPPTGVAFQSKDIFAQMDEFQVREDGSLWILKGEPDWDWDFIERFGGEKRPDDWVKPPAPKWEPCKHTGLICFYDGDELTYSAVFDKGHLVWVGKSDNDEYYRPHAVWKHLIELVQFVIDRNEHTFGSDDRKDLDEVISILRVL